MNPLVSVIVPTKNAISTIKQCLLSIKAQDYKKIEIILVDNYSTDQTFKIAKFLVNKIFLKGPERSTQRNFGVRKASGEFIAWFDADMVLSKTVISDCVMTIKNNPEFKALVIPELSKGKGFWAKCRELEKKCYIGDDKIEGIRFMYKSTFNKVGKQSENLISGEDWDLTSRVRVAGLKIGRIKSYVYHNEGHLRFIPTLKKKYYYATKSLPYINIHVKSIWDIFFFIFRPAYFRNWRLLLKDPIHALGLIFLKTCEFSVGSIGIILTKIRQ